MCIQKHKHLCCIRVCSRGVSDLQGREVMVNQESQATNGDNQELHSERVVVPIVSRLEFQVDQVHSGVCTSDVNDLKDTHTQHAKHER